MLQVGFSDIHGNYVEDMDEMEKALVGSEYTLNREQTELNDGIAMINTKSEKESADLMELGEVKLPSGYVMEIPT